MPKNSTRALYENVTIPELYNMTHARSLLPLFLKFDRSAAVARFRQRYKTQEHYQESMKNMYALITQIDQACRDIVEEIKAQGLLNETMIIFTTDNGIHDPRMPESKRGSVNDEFTLNVDLAETILGAAGLPPHPGMQGRDIADLYLEEREAVRKERPWRDEFFYELDVDEGRHVPASNALVRKKFKYIHWYSFDHEQLFNLEDDPFEFTDVKDRPEYADILNEMRERMAVLKVEAAGGPNVVKKECKKVDSMEMERRYSMTAVESIDAFGLVNASQSNELALSIKTG
jgi:arylsulfatase